MSQINDHDDVNVISAQLAALRVERDNAEADFCAKRAVFKELYVQKEEELRESRHLLRLESLRVADLITELDNLKTAAALNESTRQDELRDLRSKYLEEVASCQQIIKELLTEADRATQQRHEMEREQWCRERASLQSDLREAQQQLQREEASLLGAVAKSLRRVTTTSHTTSEATNESDKEREESMMRKTQCDVDMLRSIVVPYEEEIRSLKVKVREAYGQVDELRSKSEQMANKGVVDVAQFDDMKRQLKIERANAEVLQLSWQRSTDLLMASQRTSMLEVRRLESLLTEEQRRQLVRLRLLEDSLQSAALDGASSSSLSPRQLHRKPSCDDVAAAAARLRKKSRSDCELRNTEQKKNDSSHEVCLAESFETRSLFEFNSSSSQENICSSSKHVLASYDDLSIRRRRSDAYVEMQQQHLPTSSSIPLQGNVLIPEKEWSQLKLELKAARSRLSRPCEMCKNYEDQLQNLRINFSEKDKKLRLVNDQLEAQLRTTGELQQANIELKERLKNLTSSTQDRLEALLTTIIEAGERVQSFEKQTLMYRESIEKKVSQLTLERESLQIELTRLEKENESLCDKHSKTAAILREEMIVLPTDEEELNLFALRLREDLICARAAKEHVEESLRADLMLMSEQLLAERKKCACLKERNASRSSESVDIECSSSLQLKFKTMLTDMKAALDRSQHESTQLRNRCAALQVELRNSELVQKDFVKLSQSLQIELEAVRNEAKEVRWKDEDDVVECTACSQNFSLTRRKHHCRHCGRVFCADCTTKSVPSGPHQRAARVCDVCHTLLNSHAVPYFSVQPPK